MAPIDSGHGVTDRSPFECMMLLLASGIGSGVLVLLSCSFHKRELHNFGIFLSAQEAKQQVFSSRPELHERQFFIKGALPLGCHLQPRLPRAMAAVGWEVMLGCLIIAFVISGTTTYILALGVLEASVGGRGCSNVET